MKALLLLFALSLAPALELAEAYQAWAQGRPDEALPVLAERAQHDDTWAAWCDYGLAAAACNDHGHAVAALLRAHLLAPEQDAPVQGLVALGQTPPESWLRALGPIALPASGGLGLALALLVGGGLGWSLAGTRRRLPAALLALVALTLLLPGLVARLHDSRRPLIVTVTPTWLLDASGTPLREITAGTILELRRPTPWEGRWLVTTPGGLRGAVSRNDCGPPP
jgi:hypothetical protein